MVVFSRVAWWGMGGGELEMGTGGAMMTFEISRNPCRGTIEFRGTFDEADIVILKLDPVDRALLREVGNATHASSADYLLLLEMLFRRYAEQCVATKETP